MPTGSRQKRPGAVSAGLEPAASPRADGAPVPSPAELALAGAQGRSGRAGKRGRESAPASASGPVRAASPARVPASSSALPAAGASIYRDERRLTRRKRLVAAAVLLALIGISTCFTTSSPRVVSPVEVVQILAASARQLWLYAFDPASALSGSELMAAHPTYYWTITHAQVTLVYTLSGAMLALSGVLYQNVFRNPIAAPSMLGVSSGIQLGIAILILVFGTVAGVMVFERYAFCFAIVAVVLAALFGLAKLMGGAGRPVNVTNMLVVGVILNQLVGVVVTYITWYRFDEEQYDVFISMTSMIVPGVNLVTWAILLLGFAVAVVPVVLLRFRLNALGFAPSEMRMFGVNAARLQAVALFCGTVVMVCAQLQVGLVAMVTLVVPHISRAVFGSEFRKQLSGALLIGAAVLVGCHIVALAIPYGGEVPVDVVVNLVLLPAFVWLIATQQGRWD